MKNHIVAILVLTVTLPSLGGCVSSSDSDLEVSTSHFYNPMSWGNNPAAADYARVASKSIEKCAERAKDSTGFKNSNVDQRMRQSCAEEANIPTYASAPAYAQAPVYAPPAAPANSVTINGKTFIAAQ